MRNLELTVDTARREIFDLTDAVADFAADGAESGLLNVYVPHATCGLALIETGSGSEPDLVDALERLLPATTVIGIDTALTATVRTTCSPALLSPSVTIPVTAGRALLGPWQRVVLVDLNQDNPSRRVILSFVAG